jgi:hypothetical protein
MQFVGACASEIWPLKQLKDENSGLERMVVDLTLNRSMPAEMCLNESGQANCSPLGRRSPAGGLWHQRSLGLPSLWFWPPRPSLCHRERADRQVRLRIWLEELSTPDRLPFFRISCGKVRQPA